MVQIEGVYLLSRATVSTNKPNVHTIPSLNNIRQKEDQGSRTEKADSQENQRVTQDKPRKTSWTATEFPYGHYIIFGTRRNVINVVT